MPFDASQGSAVQQLAGERGYLRLYTGLHPSCGEDEGNELARHFDDALVMPTTDSVRALYAAAERIAICMRAAALPPERALVGLKALLRHHGGPGWSPSLVAGAHELKPRRESLLYQRVFRRWLDAYFTDRS